MPIIVWGPSLSSSYSSWIYNYLCNQCISLLVSSNPSHGEVYSIQHYVINFVSDLQQFGDFCRVPRFCPPIKMTFITEILLKVALNTIVRITLLPVFLYCPFVIEPSGFSTVYSKKGREKSRLKINMKRDYLHFKKNKKIRIFKNIYQLSVSLHSSSGHAGIFYYILWFHMIWRQA